MGRQIAIRANFFEIVMPQKEIMVQQYHVEIDHPGNRKLDK